MKCASKIKVRYSLKSLPLNAHSHLVYRIVDVLFVYRVPISITQQTYSFELINKILCAVLELNNFCLNLTPDIQTSCGFEWILIKYSLKIHISIVVYLEYR